MKSELHLLSGVHPDFEGCGISAINETSGPLIGRPYGGVAILWRRSISRNVKMCKYDDARLLGIEVHLQNDKLLFINVYMPYQCEQNYDDFMLYLGKLTALIGEAETTKIGCYGDFNAKVNTLFSTELVNWCQASNLIMSDTMWLGPDSGTFTYVSAAHNTTSWLDHIICSNDMHCLLSNIKVLDNVPTSDHLPLACEWDFHVDTDKQPHHNVSVNSDIHKGFKWERASDDCIHQYCLITKQKLNDIKIPHDALSCNDVNCIVDSHRQDLDCFYNSICNALLSSSKVCIDTVKSSKNHNVPGWNEHCKDLHADARESYILWRDMGKPRSGPICELMRRSRLRFKYAFRQCKRQEKVERANAMAKDLESKDLRSFWNKVTQLQNKKLPIPTHVNGSHGEQDITHMWKDHYETIMNCVNNDVNKSFVLSSIDKLCNTDRIVVTATQVKDALKDVKKGKSPGLDGLSAEHFIYADGSICVYLALLYSSLLLHGYLPVNFMRSAILPIIKNKTGDTSDKGNYRPVAIVNPCSKIFECIVLSYIDQHLVTNDNQFGFKKKHGTDLCIFALKNVIDYYKQCRSPVFTCFLDASKAFDRVNHWTLFRKMIEKKVPNVIIRILLFWYRQQDICVKWGQCLSSHFKVSNGVRQGSLCSPKMFALYVDGLSELLINSNIGCYIANVCFNHVFYADDLCLIAPSAIALQKLINICSKYGIQHDIVYNPLKSVCMVFKPKGYKLQCPLVCLDNDNIEYVTSVKYLGVIISASLNDNDEILKQMRGLYARSNTFLRKFALCSKEVKQQLFQTYCTNIYSAHLWCSYNSQSYNKVKVAYHNAYRTLFGYERFCSASNMLVTNNVDSFDCLIRKTVFGFKARVSNSNNNLVNTLFHNYNVNNGAMFRTWSNVLYCIPVS